MNMTENKYPTISISSIDQIDEETDKTTGKLLGAIAPAVIDENGKMCGFVHSVETGAAVDGPGVRFALFLSGCQFRCVYCHNPDTWKLRNGTLRSVENVVEEIGKYAKFLKFAGGVTFTGGEPMMQAHFVGEIAYRLKKQYNLHIALDTQGFLAPHLDDAWFDHIDLIMLDIKHIDPEKYLTLVGQPLQPTLDFAERMIHMKKKMWIRYVLVPGWTDDLADVEKHAMFVKHLADLGKKLHDGQNLIERVEILPFHNMGADKWVAASQAYLLRDTPAPTPELIEKVRSIYTEKGLLAV